MKLESTTTSMVADGMAPTPAREQQQQQPARARSHRGEVAKVKPPTRRKFLFPLENKEGLSFSEWGSIFQARAMHGLLDFLPPFLARPKSSQQLFFLNPSALIGGNKLFERTQLNFPGYDRGLFSISPGLPAVVSYNGGSIFTLRHVMCQWRQLIHHDRHVCDVSSSVRRLWDRIGPYR